MKDFIFAFVCCLLVDAYADISTKLASWIALRAASYLPRKHRRRHQDEWLADLQTRHRLLRLFFAFDLFRASFLIRREYVIIAFTRRGWKPQFTASADLLAKRILDVCFALVALWVMTPWMLLVAALVRLTSRGPLLRREMCHDGMGRSFNLYSFRISSLRAAGLTRFQHFLYQARLDLLPRLFNVLNGTLSIVGVRAATLADNSLRLHLRNTRRAAARPGLIVNDELEDCPTCGMVRDLDYVQRWSMLLDLKLMVAGTWKLLAGRPAPWGSRH